MFLHYTDGTLYDSYQVCQTVNVLLTHTVLSCSQQNQAEAILTTLMQVAVDPLVSTNNNCSLNSRLFPRESTQSCTSGEQPHVVELHAALVD